MAAKDRTTFEIDLDARKAKAGLDQLRREAHGAAGPMGALGGSVKNLQERAGKMGAAISSTAGAFGGLGTRAGAAFGAVNNLAGAFAMGGPLAVGLTAAAIGGAAVITAFSEMTKEAEALEGASGKIAQALRLQLRAELDGIVSSVESVDEQLRSLHMGATARTIALAELSEFQQVERQKNITSAVTATEAEVDLLERDAAKRRREHSIADLEHTKSRLLEADEKLATAREILDSQRIRKEEANARIAAARQLTDDLRSLEDAEKAKAQVKEKAAAKANQKPLVSSSSGSFDLDLAAIGIADPRIAAQLQVERNQIEAHATAERDAMAKASAEYQLGLLAQINDEHLKSDIAASAEREKAETERRKKEFDAEKQLAAETLALRKQYTDEALSYTSQLITSVFGTFLDTVEKIAAGEKIAFTEIASAFLAEQGRQIFGIGLKYAVEGAGMIAASSGMSPAGYATLAAGVTGMAIGGAMATSGAVVAGSSRAATAAAGGGTSRGGISTRGPTSPRGGESSTGSGGITIVYNGGVHLGNTADFTSTLSRESRRADREIFASRRVA